MQVFVLALAAALYPTLLAAVVILLSQPRRVVLLGSYLAGGLTMSISIGLVIVFALEGSGAVERSQSTLNWTLDLALGGLALLAAVTLATRADQRFRQRRQAKKPLKAKAKSEDRDPWSQRILARGSVPIVFIAGVLINVPGTAYLAGLKDIAQANYSTVEAILLIVAFNLIMFMLAEVPFVGLLVAPARTEALVVRCDGWLSRNGRRIAMVLAAFLGIYLIIRGISKLNF